MLVANIKIEKPLKYQRRLGLLSAIYRPVIIFAVGLTLIFWCTSGLPGAINYLLVVYGGKPPHPLLNSDLNEQVTVVGKPIVVMLWELLTSGSF